MVPGQPPARADHIGSLLRPQKLREAFRAARRQGDLGRRFPRRTGRGDPRRGQAAGGLRPAGGDRRRIPPHLLLGEVRAPDRRAWWSRTRCSSSTTSTATSRTSPRPTRKAKVSRARADHRSTSSASSRKLTKRDAEDHHALALDHALLPLHRLGRSEGVRRRGARSSPTWARSISRKSRSCRGRAAATCSSTRWRSPCSATRRRATR